MNDYPPHSLNSWKIITEVHIGTVLFSHCSQNQEPPWSLLMEKWYFPWFRINLQFLGLTVRHGKHLSLSAVATFWKTDEKAEWKKKKERQWRSIGTVMLYPRSHFSMIWERDGGRGGSSEEGVGVGRRSWFLKLIVHYPKEGQCSLQSHSLLLHTTDIQ